MSPPAEADVLLAMDADTLPVDVLEPVLEQVRETGAIAGVIAHYPPFPQPPEARRPASIRERWRQLSQGLLDAPLDSRYSHADRYEIDTEQRAAPFYLNFGVVFFPRDAFRRIAPLYLTLRPQLMARMLFPDFSGQAALTLAIAAEKEPKTWALPMRTNSPTRPTDRSRRNLSTRSCFIT